MFTLLWVLVGAVALALLAFVAFVAVGVWVDSKGGSGSVD